MTCTICNKRGAVGIGGSLFCREHAAIVEMEIERLRADGNPVDAAKIAATLRGEEGKDYLLRDVPADLWRQAKAAAALRGVTIREVLIDALRESVGK